MSAMLMETLAYVPLYRSPVATGGWAFARRR